jgi:hypothetical protein
MAPKNNRKQAQKIMLEELVEDRVVLLESIGDTLPSPRLNPLEGSTM